MIIRGHYWIGMDRSLVSRFQGRFNPHKITFPESYLPIVHMGNEASLETSFSYPQSESTKRGKYPPKLMHSLMGTRWLPLRHSIPSCVMSDHLLVASPMNTQTLVSKNARSRRSKHSIHLSTGISDAGILEGGKSRGLHRKSANFLLPISFSSLSSSFYSGNGDTLWSG